MDNAAQGASQKLHVSFMEPHEKGRSLTDEERSEIEEMRAARQEQDHLITRLTEDNVHLEATVAHLENALCKLQAQLQWSSQSLETLKTIGSGGNEQGIGQGDSLGDSQFGKDYEELSDEAHADFIEATILRQHAHCSPDTCWKQKYTESLSQLRSVLEELKNELEDRGGEEQTIENQVARRQSKVQLIEESIRTLAVNHTETSTERNHRRSRKRSILGLDSSLRRVKISRTSSSQVSISKAPLYKRVMNLFKKKSSGDSTNLNASSVSAK